MQILCSILHVSLCMFIRTQTHIPTYLPANTFLHYIAGLAISTETGTMLLIRRLLPIGFTLGLAKIELLLAVGCRKDGTCKVCDG